MKTVEERFWSKVDVRETTLACWPWLGAKTPAGYGTFSLEGKTTYAHRLATRLAGAEVPPDLELDHLCRNRACCNPSHLEAVTHRENVRRGDVGKAESARMSCPAGHTYDAENTSIRDGKRRCKTCARASDKERYLRRKRGI